MCASPERNQSFQPPSRENQPFEKRALVATRQEQAYDFLLPTSQDGVFVSVGQQRIGYSFQHVVCDDVRGPAHAQHMPRIRHANDLGTPGQCGKVVISSGSENGFRVTAKYAVYSTKTLVEGHLT